MAQNLTQQEQRALDRIRVAKAAEDEAVAEVRNEYRSLERVAVLEKQRPLDKMVADALFQFGSERGGHLSKNLIRQALGTTNPSAVNERLGRNRDA